MRLKRLFNKCLWVPKGIHKIVTNVGSATGLQDHPSRESDSGPEDFSFPLKVYLAPCTKLNALDNPVSETHGLSYHQRQSSKEKQQPGRAWKEKKKCSSAWGLRRKRRTGPWQFVSLWLMVPDFSFRVKSSSDVQCHLVLWLPTPPSPKCRAGLVRFPSSDNFSDYLFWYFNLDNSVHFLCVALAGVTVSVYTSLPSFLFFFPSIFFTLRYPWMVFQRSKKLSCHRRNHINYTFVSTLAMIVPFL